MWGTRRRDLGCGQMWEVQGRTDNNFNAECAEVAQRPQRKGLGQRDAKTTERVGLGRELEALGVRGAMRR